MKLFTAFDQFEGRCNEDEVGTEWQDRWGIPDMQAGDCNPRMVGKPKDPAMAPPEPPPEPTGAFTPLTREQRKALIQELADKLLIMAHTNPEAFLDDNGPQLNKFLDMASKLDEQEDRKDLPFELMSRKQLQQAIQASLQERTGQHITLLDMWTSVQLHASPEAVLAIGRDMAALKAERASA